MSKSANPNSTTIDRSVKLNKRAVATIRKWHAKGLKTIRAMAQHYGVGIATVTHCLYGRTWKGV